MTPSDATTVDKDAAANDSLQLNVGDLLADPRPNGPLIVELSSTSATDDAADHNMDAAAASEPADLASLPHLYAAGMHGVPAEHVFTVVRQITPQAVQRANTALGNVPHPPEHVYAPFGGAPEDPLAADQTDAQLCSSTAAGALRELANAVDQLESSNVDFGIEDLTTQMLRAAHRPASSRGVLRPGVLIEEVPDDQDLPPKPERVSAASVLLACGLYGADSALDGAWVSSEASAAAMAVLGALASKLPGTRVGTRSEDLLAGAGSDTSSASMQTAIQRCLPALMDRLKPVLGEKKQRQRKRDIPEPMQFSKAEGPSIYERSLAARELAWLVRQLGSQVLTVVLLRLLPAVLATLDDPSPFVERQGLRALQHIAVTAPAEELRLQRDLLLHTAQRVITGADERVWPAAAPCAVFLMIAVEGAEPWAAGYDELMRAMLGEAELHMHQPQRTAAWLLAMQSLIPVLGLVTVRYFSRLLPLVLGWLHSPDEVTQKESSRLLQTIICSTWPRIQAHAGLIKQHLSSVARSATVRSDDPALMSQVNDIAGVAELLAWCGADARSTDLHAERFPELPNQAVQSV